MTAKSSVGTRVQTKMLILDKHPDKIKKYTLPTFEDVLRHYEWLRHEKKQLNQQEPPAKNMIREVAQAVMEVWKTASIPTVTEERVQQLLTAYRDQHKQLSKNFNRNPKGKSYLDKIHNFTIKSSQIFDIAACKCTDYSTCKCGKLKAIPIKERIFLEDQRTVRGMAIGSVDIKTTKKLRQKNVRLEKQNKPRFTDSLPSPSGNLSLTDSESESEKTSADREYSDKLKTTSVQESNEGKIHHNNLEKLAEVCDRYGISYRAGAAIASATLSDIQGNDTRSTVIDHSRLRRKRIQRRQTLLQKQEISSIEALFFDGRKDQTLYYVKDGNKLYRRVRAEEHITIVKEPGSEYIGHVTPPSGTSKDIEKSMYLYLAEKKIDMTSLMAVGCDGTNVNTGRKNGVIVALEKRLSRPVQWLVCQLHANELPLRHLIGHLDGKTTGPKTFSGPIGTKLSNCENKPVTEFEPIAVELPMLSNVKLSTDQQYLYDICVAVSTGIISPDLAKRNPGKMSHARWLTTANRILRLYVATKRPTAELTLLAKYICQTYSPSWFQIKVNSSCKDGARNLWFLIESTRDLPEDIKAVIYPVIQRNAYFAHPENILLSMLTDKKTHIRELACRRILKARAAKKTKTVRSFNIPKINFDATEYYDMIDWQDKKLVVTQPPLLHQVETSQLEEIVNLGNLKLIDFPKFPCHTQSVERCVKLTTEAAGSVAGNKAREGFILCKIHSRKLMPKFNSKKDFK